MRTALLTSVLALTLATALPGIALAAESTPTSETPVIVAFPQPHPATAFGNSFGNRRPGGRRHQGIDLMGEKMMPVVAIADGFITRVSRGRRSGYHVYIRHADGWESWYMHLNNDTQGSDDGDGGPQAAFAPGIEEGAFVAAGQIIGWVGDSGNAEGKQPHTHFELHHDGRVVNPYRHLVAAWERQLRAWALEGIAA